MIGSYLINNEQYDYALIADYGLVKVQTKHISYFQNRSATNHSFFIGSNP